MKTRIRLRGFAVVALPLAVALSHAHGPADPIQKDAGKFDTKRPIEQEMRTDVPDGLYAVEEGYGERLPRSGIPRLVGDPADAARIFRQIDDANRRFGVAHLELAIAGNVATVAPPRRAPQAPPQHPPP